MATLQELHLFEVVIIQRPTAEEREQGGKDALILGPTQVMAATQGTAVAAAVQKNADALKGIDLSNVELVVRKFIAQS